jgi:hypothetical protein
MTDGLHHLSLGILMKNIFLMTLLVISCLFSIPLFSDEVEDFSHLYLLSYTKSSQFPELEDLYRSQGMIVSQKSIETYNGIVVEMDDGTYLDPIEQIRFSIDRKGVLSCPANPTVRGFRNKRTGEFQWEGYIDFFGQLKFSQSRGTLKQITPKDVIPMENSGIFKLYDSDGKVLTASVYKGFLIIKSDSLESGSPYRGWPTLIQADGHFSSSFSLATEVSMGQIGTEPKVQTLHNADVVTEGFISSEGEISLTFYNAYAAISEKETNPVESFSGTVINTEETSLSPLDEHKEYEIYLKDLERRNIHKVSSPDWYLNLPQDDFLLYAAGSRTLEDKPSALEMAEVIAASGLANQIKVQIQSEFTDSEKDNSAFVQELIRVSSRENLEYTRVEAYYDDDSHTAYVLLSIKKESIE